MAALEYLTSNSLISYPFKTGRAILETTSHPIEDDWFYDILISSFSDSVRSVYISKIKKTALGGLEVTFSNTETLTSIGVAVVTPENLVSHYKNVAKSFSAHNLGSFAVKLVFGPGLVAKTAFEQVYTFPEASIANAAIILNHPSLRTLTFEAYKFDPSVSSTPTLEEVMEYSYPEVPTVQPTHNASFSLDSLNKGSLYVTRGAGAGLYDGCPEIGEIQDVYSLSNIFPNTKGALFLNTSSCYAANTLSASNETLYGTHLDKYRNFEVFTSPTTTSTVDVVHVGHSITFENFCKPKCPHENLNAYAHYLNRVADGAQDLDTAVSRAVETRGQGSSFLKVFTAEEFCVTGDSVFARCTDPADPESYVECGEGFLKNYHEGRTLQLYYDNLTIRNYTIVEVIDEYVVRLDNIPPPAQTADLLSFRVLDNGVISNLNCAALAYNKNAESFLKTYYQVTYTTNEAYSEDGTYNTNLALVVSLYNPSPTVVQLKVNFSPTVLTQASSYKVRTSESIYTVEVPDILLGCRQYAFIETVFSIPCATAGGFLDIEVFEKIGLVWTPVGSTYSLPEIIGAECPNASGGSSNGGEPFKFRVSQQEGAAFNESLPLSPSTQSVSEIYGNAPSWLATAFNSADHALELSASEAPAANTSQRYNLYFRSYSPATTTLWQLIIEYIASPEIVSPLSARFSSQNPLVLSKEVIYTEDNPVLQVFATNMLILSQDFDVGPTAYFYSISTGTLPAGLSFDTSTGKITGQLASGVLDGALYQITITATNPSGVATNPQTIFLGVAVQTPPIITLVSPPANDTYTASNLEVYTAESPLVSFSVVNTPIYSYTIVGGLPAGLYFNRITGSITGRITATIPGSSELFISTDNAYGQSNVVSITINYVIYSKPSITYPAAAQVINIGLSEETTEASPLFTITSLQAYGGSDNYAEGLTDTTRNSYQAAGIPAGFTLDRYTGKFYGKLADTELPSPTPTKPYTLPYALRLGAYNPIGSDNVSLFIYFYSARFPVITGLQEDTTFPVVKGKTYTVSNPLLTFSALNSPTSFEVTGLPPGLTCTPAGRVIGTVALSSPAGTYDASVTAHNEHGASAAVNFNFNVPISLLTPTDTEFSVVVFETVTDLFSVEACDILGGDTATITVTDLPADFTFTDGSVSGSSTVLGLSIVHVKVTTESYGSAELYVRLNITPLTYSVSGTVLDGDGEPVADAIVTNGLGRSAITDADGKYTLYTLQYGSYNILATSSGYSMLPRFIPLQISSSNCIGIDFTAEQSTRLIRGVILDTQLNGVPGILVTDGTHEAYTNSYGVYELYASTTAEVVVTPKSSGYVFDPPSGTVPIGTISLENADFRATVSRMASAPEVLSITPGNKSFSVSFTTPTDSGGTAITNYQYSTDSGVSWLAVSPVQTTSPLSVTANTADPEFPDLVNGVLYGISIRAVNASGGGAPSIVTLASPATTPSAPTITSYIPTDVLADVYFTVPTNDGGAPITDYEYSLDDGLTYASSGRSSSPVNITGLTKGTTYNFRLRAVNAIAAGTPSALLLLAPADIPLSPTITSIVVGDGQLTVNFDLPTYTGGTELMNIGYSIDNAYSFTFPDPVVTTSPITIPDLQNGTNYFISLRAINAAFSYSAGSTSVLATPTELPDAPTDLVASIIDQGLSIDFEAPLNSAVPIQNYKYQLSSGAWIASSPEVSGPPVVITGLTNGTQYSVKLKAVISSGDGEESLPVLGTPAKPAAAPTITSITAGNALLTVFFTKSSDLGGATLEDYRYSIDSGVTYIAAAVTDISPTTGSLQVTGLVNGTTYTVTLKAKTAAGLGKFSNSLSGTPKTTPSAPTQLTTLPGDGSIAVSFVAPETSGGSVITNYKYRLDSGEWLSRTPISNSTSFIIKNLVNGKLYYLKLKAVNAVGDGEESVSVPIVPVTVPSAPTLNKIYSSENRLQIIFTVPVSDGGSFITGYEYSLDGGATFKESGGINTGASQGDSSESPYIIVSNLNNGTSYSVVLRAANYVGLGASSNTLIGKPIGAPPAPIITSISSLPAGAVVRFTPPSSNGGAAITNYAYKVTNSAGVITTTKISPAVTTSPITISGLVAGEKTVISLQAINSYGSGDFSAGFSIIPGAPSAPTIVKVTGIDSALVVSFTAPINPTSPILSYEYSLDSGVTYVKVEGTTSPITITGLTNSTNYSVQLRALNAVSGSSPSNVVTGKPTNLPSAPTITQFASHEGAGLIYFTPPTKDGGLSIEGYKYSSDGISYTTVNNATSPINVPGLVIGTSYKLYLKAFNRVGDGEVSAPLSVTVGAPSAPSIDFINSSSSAVEISFTLPDDNGSPLLNHEYSLNGSSSWVPLSPPSTESPLILSNVLTANTRYSINIRAVNERGAGIASNTVYIAKGISNIPQIESVQPENGTLTLRILPPGNYTQPIVDYKYNVYTDVDSGVYTSFNASTFPITSLTIPIND